MRRPVMEVVGEAAQSKVTDKVRQALDDDLAHVLFAGSTGGTPAVSGDVTEARMDNDRRENAYLQQSGRKNVTPRQRRRLKKKAGQGKG